MWTCTSFSPCHRGVVEVGDEVGRVGGREVIISARSLSAVGAEENDGVRGGTKFMKSVKKLIRAHECQFNEEMFQKVCEPHPFIYILYLY